MKESAFRTSVLSKLPGYVHRQPMLASFSSYPGTPDTYLDHTTDLWIEFKVLREDDRLPALIPKCSMPSDQQLAWLNRRHAAGGNAIVVIGIKIKNRAQGFVLSNPGQWTERAPRSFYEAKLRPAAMLAEYILSRIS